jgi:hypothetical protein
MACHSPTFKASRLITLLTPGMTGVASGRGQDHIAIALLSCADKLPPSPVLRPLGSLRVRNPSGCFALDGGSALAFLAR